MEIKTGSFVRVTCFDRSRFDKDPNMKKVFTGFVKSAFNAFDNEGDNWFYELSNTKGEWFLYKPRIDGGTIELLDKEEK